MLVNAGTFMFVALAGALLSARRRVVREPGERDRIRDGVVYLFRDRLLSLVLGVALVSLLFMTASATAEVFFVKQDLGASDFGFGAVFACWTIGMVAGSLLVARRVPRSKLALGAPVAIAVQSIGLGLPTVWLVIPFGAALWFAGGTGHGTKNVLVRTLIQEQVPSRPHGQAFAAYNGLRNGAELVALALGGVFAAVIGARATLALAGGHPAAHGLHRARPVSPEGRPCRRGRRSGGVAARPTSA